MHRKLEEDVFEQLGNGENIGEWVHHYLGKTFEVKGPTAFVATLLARRQSF